jgi:hypothetical protein
VTVDPDIAAAAMVPVAFDPARATIRRFSIVAGHPDIVGAVPAVEAGLPDPSLVGCDGNHFNGTRRGWPNTDHNLSVGRSSRERDAADSDEDRLLDLHGVLLLEEESFLLSTQTQTLERKLW